MGMGVGWEWGFWGELGMGGESGGKEEGGWGGRNGMAGFLGGVLRGFFGGGERGC